MNRYTAEGITYDLVQGKKILVVTSLRTEQVSAVEYVKREIDKLGLPIERITYSHGADRIEVSGGGVVEFRNVHATRGAPLGGFDTALVLGAAGHDQEVMAVLWPRISEVMRDQ